MRLRLFLVLLTVAACLSACDTGSSGSSPGPQPGPAVGFVGNASCPTAGNTPYNNGQAPATNGPPVGQVVDEMPHAHVTPPTTITYQHDPPTSGCHYSLAGGATQLSAPAPRGVYNQEIPPEYWVHNLEHGYTVVLYNCPAPPGCSTDFDVLHNWYKGLAPDPSLNAQCGSYAKVLVLPSHTLKPKFALLFWDWYDPMTDKLDMNEVQRFYDNHIDHGPEVSNC